MSTAENIGAGEDLIARIGDTPLIRLERVGSCLPASSSTPRPST